MKTHIVEVTTGAGCCRLIGIMLYVATDCSEPPYNLFTATNPLLESVKKIEQQQQQREIEIKAEIYRLYRLVENKYLKHGHHFSSFNFLIYNGASSSTERRLYPGCV